MVRDNHAGVKPRVLLSHQSVAIGIALAIWVASRLLPRDAGMGATTGTSAPHWASVIGGTPITAAEKNRSTITSHLCPRAIVWRICKTIIVNNQNRQPMLCFPLLLVRISMSTYRIGESMSQKAIVGMFPSATSLIGWWSVIGSVRMRR